MDYVSPLCKIIFCASWSLHVKRVIIDGKQIEVRKGQVRLPARVKVQTDRGNQLRFVHLLRAIGNVKTSLYVKVELVLAEL